MKTFHLVTKQTHIASTTFDFRDYEDNSILHMRISKDSKWHNDWAALEEGGKFTLMHGDPVPVIKGDWGMIDTAIPEDYKAGTLFPGESAKDHYANKSTENEGL